VVETQAQFHVSESIDAHGYRSRISNMRTSLDRIWVAAAD
jgi:hypothetical protein